MALYNAARLLHNQRDAVIDVVLGETSFEATDNCGGMTLDVARNYAFRFGRPSGGVLTPNSIGRFGVGMKRTLFKLGNWFCVSSTTATTKFSVEVDVDEWKKKTEWMFAFSNATDGKFKSTGTSIRVTNLHASVAKQLGDPQFQSLVAYSIAQAHSGALAKGLTIRVNGTVLKAEAMLLKASKHIRPSVNTHLISVPGIAEVRLKLIAGIAGQEYGPGGWYVFCNDRLVLTADKSPTTGWGTQGVRSYHSDVAYFRGFAFFDSDDAEAVPWTTTKTGLDVDSPVYRAARSYMVRAMEPILKFCRDLANERGDIDKGLLSDGARVLLPAVDEAPLKPIYSIPPNPKFAAPAPGKREKRAKVGHILYQMPIERIERVREMFQLASYKEVGTHSFEYLWEREVGE